MERSIPFPGSTQLPLKSRCRDCNYRKVDPVAGTGDTAKKKTKMTKLDFHRFQVRHFSNTFEHCCAAVELGQRQRADISLFIATYNSPTGEISAFERIHALQPPFCFLGHPYIGRHYRVSLILSYDQCRLALEFAILF